MILKMIIFVLGLLMFSGIRTKASVEPAQFFFNTLYNTTQMNKEKRILKQKQYCRTYRRTPSGLISNIYGAQKNGSKKRNHPMPEYTNHELREWALSQPIFHILYNNWVKSNFDKKLTPSFDRKNDYSPYTLDNLQIMTWENNMAKGHFDRRNGINNKVNKSIVMLNNAREVAVFYSMQEAGRNTGVSVGNISSCCNGNRETAGGYKWNFKNE